MSTARAACRRPSSRRGPATRWTVGCGFVIGCARKSRHRRSLPSSPAPRRNSRSTRGPRSPPRPRRISLRPPNSCSPVASISLGVPRADIRDPDWFHDPVTGRSAPKDRFAFRIRYRSEHETGNVKQVWELSRHHHLTLLSGAYFLTQDERYADIVRCQLESWWRENPFLSGVHWTSGIEIGLRLIAWTWIRRLLATWPGVKSLFDENPRALRQIHWHQRYLARFRSVGSSANNHVIAEAAGQLVAACGLPWFQESERWRVDAAALLEAELRRNTFATGINRELASEYHTFVAMLGLVAAVECDAARAPLDDGTWHVLCAMVDAAAAIVDEGVRPPRQGDGDDARVLAIDGDRPGWSSFLAVGGALFEPLPWWPDVPGTVVSTLVATLAHAPRTFEDRPPTRPSHFSRRGNDGAPNPSPRGTTRSGDLVPMRRRPSRLSLDRRARACRRTLGRSPLRRRRRPRRSRNLLLPRRSAVAVLLPVDARAQHRRDRRTRPVALGRPVPVGAIGPQLRRPSDVD